HCPLGTTGLSREGTERPSEMGGSLVEGSRRAPKAKGIFLGGSRRPRGARRSFLEGAHRPPGIRGPLLKCCDCPLRRGVSTREGAQRPSDRERSKADFADQSAAGQRPISVLSPVS